MKMRIWGRINRKMEKKIDVSDHSVWNFYSEKSHTLPIFNFTLIMPPTRKGKGSLGAGKASTRRGETWIQHKRPLLYTPFCHWWSRCDSYHPPSVYESRIILKESQQTVLSELCHSLSPAEFLFSTSPYFPWWFLEPLPEVIRLKNWKKMHRSEWHC